MTIGGLGSDETLPPAVLALENAIVEFTGCIRDALPDICSVGFTLGESYVPFDPDPGDSCSATEAQCSQAWIRITDVQPAPGGLEGFSGQNCALSLIAGLEVGVLRCMEVPKKGRAPTETDVLVYGMQSLADMNAILCAALSCEVWEGINVGQWQPQGPLGGQYGGVWAFTVEL
ncbi:hypothetical protein [Aeromicrobium sp.]|uniref:hypothetical protein n=1 Tax=Aeromicrobium sp. TaxID=1871063 RepID=UPI001994634E|nr:hypothetical protein [Aeromicrobium sp.]MBC7630407.1 hypothetical protein [Aeromicrobium sp.]